MDLKVRLAELRKTARSSRETADTITGLVQQLRSDGASWGDIGKALGVSRQAAWRRFKHLDAYEPPD